MDQRRASQRWTQPIALKQQIPAFVVPPKYLGRHGKHETSDLEDTEFGRVKTTDLETTKFGGVESNTFMCNLGGQSRSQNRQLVKVFNEVISDFPKEEKFLYDPGLSTGMTLKHIPLTTSSYGFPMLMRSASWEVDEAQFHEENMASRKRSNAFICKERRSIDSLQLSRGKPPVVVRLQRHTTDPLLRKKSSIAADDIEQTLQTRSSSSLSYTKPAQKRPIVYSNLRDDAARINNEIVTQQHSIEFSCRRTIQGKVQIKIQSVCIPSKQRKDRYRVRVWVGNKTMFRSAKYTNWVSDALFDEMTLYFGDTFEFKLPFKPSDRFLHLSVLSRRPSQILPTEVHGRVQVPIPQETQCITRHLEATPKIPKAYISVCFNPQQKKLHINGGKIVGIPRSTLCSVTGLSVFVTLETMVDGVPLVLKRTTAVKKKDNRSDFLVWQPMSFAIPSPNWETIRHNTILTFAVRCHKRFVKKYILNLGQVELGIDVPVQSGMEHWKHVTKFPGGMFTRWHYLRVSED